MNVSVSCLKANQMAGILPSEMAGRIQHVSLAYGFERFHHSCMHNGGCPVRVH